MIVKQILVGSMANFTYIIIDEKSKLAAVVDPSWDLENVLNMLKINNLKLKYIM